jgi:hypothetical protein
MSSAVGCPAHARKASPATRTFNMHAIKSFLRVRSSPFNPPGKVALLSAFAHVPLLPAVTDRVAPKQPVMLSATQPAAPHFDGLITKAFSHIQHTTVVPVMLATCLKSLNRSALGRTHEGRMQHLCNVQDDATKVLALEYIIHERGLDLHRRACRTKMAHNWLWKPLGSSTRVTALQASVLHTLRRLGYCCESEANVRGLFVDIGLLQHSAVVEVDGPLHFTVNTGQELGATQMKHRLLRGMGLKVVTVRYHELPCGERERETFLLGLLQAAGIGSPESGGEGQWAARQRGAPVGCSVAAGDMAGDAPLAVGIHDRDSVDDRDGLPTEGSGEKGLQCVDLEVVAERAAALNLMQYKRGSLSKRELLFKAALRKARPKNGKYSGGKGL